MPKIKDFGACRIEMYFGDHPPPHFHIVTPNGKVVVRIEDMRIIAGGLPQRTIHDVLKWARANKALLMAKWREYSEEEQQ
jgi:uncharacterized protein DUF4160